MAETRRARRLRAGLVAAGLALIVAGCGSSSNSNTQDSASTASTSAMASTPSTAIEPGAPGPEKVPLERGPALAPASTTSPGNAVDGIHCAPVEQLAYHIHAHLQVYLNGRPRSLPGAIGLLNPVVDQTPVGPFYSAQQCYYWLHTHTSDGVIHMESPTARIYTLGNFFDEWRQPLSAHQVATAKGRVTAFVNGRRWTGNPRQIPLRPHAVIQLDVGSPIVPFSSMSWAKTVL